MNFYNLDRCMKNHRGFVSIISALIGAGVSGLVVLLVAATVGASGGAAIVAALAAMGGPLGMIGGVAVVGMIAIISKEVAQAGIEKWSKTVIVEYVKQHGKEAALEALVDERLNKFNASKSLANSLYEFVETDEYKTWETSH